MTRPQHAIAVANYFIGNCDNLTQISVQKLVYFSHGWHMAVIGDPLITEFIYAGPYGPVVPSLSLAFNGYSNSVINGFIDVPTIGLYRLQSPDKLTIDVLDKVIQQYGCFSWAQLSNMAHKKGTPWHQVQSGEIDNQIIKDYFICLAKETAGDNDTR